MLASFATRLAAQSPPPVQVTSFATGVRPIGVAVTRVPVAAIAGSMSIGHVAVANSGDDTVSVGLTSPSLVKGIPSPFGVVDCGVSGNDTVGYVGNVLVSSPSDRSLWLLSVSNQGVANVIGKIQTASQPYSVACYGSALASNPDDNSLTIVDPSKLAVVATIPDVPGSRAVHAIAIGWAAGSYVAWVAGTDANVVTLVNLSSMKVVGRIPVSRPTAVVGADWAPGNPGYIYVASGGAGTITAYDPVTVSSVPSLQFASVPNPQDINISALGNFAISGGASPGQESLWRFDLASKAGMTGRVVDMPGAAALASSFPLKVGESVSASNTTLYATSTSANRAYVIQQASGPQAFVISNAASFDQANIAPGALASMFPATGATQSFKAPSTPLPLVLGGVTVSFGGTLTFDTPNNKWVYSPAGSLPAAVLFVGPNQVNVQIPPGIAPASGVAAQLTKADGTTYAGIFNYLSATAPGIFTVSQDGRGQGAVQNSDFSQNGSPQVLPGSRPAARGEMIIIYATGAGDTTPSLAAGEAAPAGGSPLVFTKVQPIVTIGGVQARVLFSGLAPGFVGLWQINAEVPASVTPGPVVALLITAGGVTSNTVTIAVQ
jgi:uncharacterized protein (TIGR03437 family)